MSGPHQSPRIRVLSQQRAARIDRTAVRAFTAFCMARAQRMRPETRWSEVVVAITDSSGIARVKERCFGRAEDTDVVALSYAPFPGENPGWTAEVIVNAERALRLASCARWSAARELALYLAHGCDHFGGALDRNPAERARMRRRELRWMRQAARSCGIERLVRLRTVRRKEPA